MSALKRASRIVGTVLIILGAVVLEFAVYELYGTSIVTHHHQAQLRQEFRQELLHPGDPVTPKLAARAIAQLQIPKLHVNVIVVDGVTLDQLAYGPGRYPSSALIGAEGTTAIAGHRTGWGSPFLNLDHLQPDDEIKLETTDGKTYVYRVTRSMVVDPGDSWVLRGDPKSDSKHKLTLTTCTPKFTSRDRLIVWANEVAVVPRT